MDDFRSDLLERKKELLRKSVKDCAEELGVPYPIAVSITEEPCPMSTGDEAAHIHVEKGVICVWERKLSQMNFDRIKEVAAHEVAHLVSKKHGSTHADAETALKVRTWRPPSGVAWIRPQRKKSIDSKESETPSLADLLEDKTVEDLKELAREKDLSGYSNMRKSELIDLVADSYTKEEIKSKEAENICSYHLCSVESEELDRCELCGETFCSEHFEPRKPNQKPWTGTGFTDRIKESGGHPCPEYVSHKMRKEKERTQEVGRALDRLLGSSNRIEVFSSGESDVDSSSESECVEPETKEDAFTGHDLATRIANHHLISIKNELRDSDRMDSIVETVNTGGLKKFQSKKSKRSYPSPVKSLENWRDFIVEEFGRHECDREVTKIILERLASEVYWDVQRKNTDINGHGWNTFLDNLNELVAEIEERTDNEGVFREVLKETGEFYEVEVRVKPWISLSGISNAKVNIQDDFGIFTKEGKTDSDGMFYARVLAGRNTIVVDTGDKKTTETYEINEDRELTVHPSIF